MSKRRSNETHLPETEPTATESTEPGEATSFVDEVAIEVPPVVVPPAVETKTITVSLGGTAGYTPGSLTGHVSPDRAVKLTRIVNGFADRGQPCDHFEALMRLIDAV